MSVAEIEAALRLAQLTELTPEALARLEAYLQLLLQWNSRMNLTSVREAEGIIRRHFVECIQCAQELPQSGERTLLDFGSGGGLPGIPIAICRPEIRVTLAEAQRKKVAFLNEAVRTLSLNAEVFDGRVEQMRATRRFGFVTLRAVDKMAQACEAGAARVAQGGWMVVFASNSTEHELKEAVPEIVWRKEIEAVGHARCKILMGQR